MENTSMENILSLDAQIGHRIPREIIMRALGYKDPNSAGDAIRGLVDEHLNAVVAAAEPQVIYCGTAFNITGNRVELPSGHVFTGKTLHQAVGKCDGLVVGLVTLGRKVDKAIAEASSQDAFCGYLMDVISGLLVEMAAHQFWQHLVGDLSREGYKATSFVSPGAAGFPLVEQRQVFSFLKPERIGVSLTDSCLMEPTKSLTLIMGYGKDIVPAKHSHDCSTCDMEDCLIRGIHIDLTESNAG